MAIGPVEYIIIEFPGNQFHGDIVPAIAKLIENETVRIIDLVFIMKDPDGRSPPTSTTSSTSWPRSPASTANSATWSTRRTWTTRPPVWPRTPPPP